MPFSPSMMRRIEIRLGNKEYISGAKITNEEEINRCTATKTSYFSKANTHTIGNLSNVHALASILGVMLYNCVCMTRLDHLYLLLERLISILHVRDLA